MGSPGSTYGPVVPRFSVQNVTGAVSGSDMTCSTQNDVCIVGSCCIPYHDYMNYAGECYEEPDVCCNTWDQARLYRNATCSCCPPNGGTAGEPLCCTANQTCVWQYGSTDQYCKPAPPAFLKSLLV